MKNFANENKRFNSVFIIAGIISFGNKNKNKQIHAVGNIKK